MKTMRLFVVGALMLGLVAEAQVAMPAQKKTPGIPKIITLLDEVEDVDGMLPAGAKEEAHVLFVNVGGALPEGVFREAVAYLRMRYNVRVVAESAKRGFALEVVKDTGYIKRQFGERTQLVVAVVMDEKAPSFINVPGFFAQVNMRGLDKDGPSGHFLKKRRTQMVCRGLAHACGVGSTLDSTCVMRSGSFVLGKMDEVSATFGPVAYFSLTEFLREVGVVVAM